MWFVTDTIENILGQEENAGYHHFLLFPQCFLKAFYQNVNGRNVCFPDC